MKKILLFSLLFSLEQIKAQVSPQPCFASAVNYNAGSTPQAVCAADFNNDGFPDFACANYNSSNASVFINTGTGTFLPAVNYAAFNGPTDIASADFNNDGNKDLVVVNFNANNFSILLGSPTGTFSNGGQMGMGTNPSGITAGDWNGDGNADVAVCNQSGGNISVRLGNGLGGFSSFTNTPSGGGLQAIINADFNNDGKKDIAVASGGGNTVMIMLGNGFGGFGTPSSFAVGSSPVCLVSADFNGDGNKDIAVGNQSSNDISILLGNGLGSFGIASNYSSPGPPYSITTGDFDSDSKIDLAVGTGAPWMGVLLGDGIGGFGSLTSFGLPSTGNGIASADFNNDTKPDVVTSNNSNNCSVFLNSLPKTNITGSTTVCYFQNTLLTATGAANYTWSPSGLTTNTINYSNCCTNTVSVIGTAPGCPISSIKTVTITVNPLPTITFTTSPSNVCTGSTATITAGGANTYTWSIGPTTSSIVITPTTSGTYSYNVTGTSAAGCQSIAYTHTVNALPKPVVTVSNATTCSGVSTQISGSGSATTYSWSTGATSQTISVAPTSNTSYTVIGTDANTCTNSAVSNVSVNPLPTVTGIASPTAVCSGSLLTLNGAGASTYTWNGGITNNVAFTATATQVYSVTGTNTNGCINSGTISVSLLTNPTLSISGTSLICLNKPQILTASGASTYTWSPSSTTGSTVSATPTVNTTYTAIGTAANGCRNAATFAITLVQPPTPNICQVTVDSLGFDNEIYWEKSLYPSADSFIVYREVSTNVYKRIVAQHKSLFSMYVDTNRSIGPANGNPNLTYYKYKLQLRDTCGNYSALSLWHETIFIQDQMNGNFNWNSYAIESSSTPVTNYNLKRRSLATGTETLVVSLVGNLASDPAYASFWPLNVRWFVDALGFNCNPTAKTMLLKSKTKSNQSNDKLATGMLAYGTSNIIKVYPNPASGILNIDMNSIAKAETDVEIQNTLGQIIYQTQALNQHLVINTADFGAGVYFVTIKQGGKTLDVKKVIIDK